MADSLDTTSPRTRRRRSDARRSVEAILEAARVVFGRHPEAGMEEIAATAGVSRQTVYAHFPSRDALLAALVEAAAAEYAALLDAAGLDTEPPADALARFLDAGWQFLRRFPVLLTPAAPTIPRPTTDDPHDVVPPRLERLIQRGQQTGEFDPSLPADWLTAAVLGLQHTAAAQVAAGRLTTDEAQELCLRSALDLCGVRAAKGE